MKKYYLHDGTAQLGPFDLEDLKTMNISKDTPIWHEGLSEWTTVERIGELKELLDSSSPPPFNVKRSNPPPIKNESSTQIEAPLQNAKPKKKNKWILAAVISVLVLGLGIGALYIYDQTNWGSGGPIDYQQQVMSVEEIERSQPTRFLSASGTYRENFWGDKFKVNCEITNDATIATYKDVVIRVTYYSKTETSLGSKEYTIYETFPPNNTKKVSLKIDNYKDVNSLGWEVVDATPH